MEHLPDFKIIIAVLAVIAIIAFGYLNKKKDNYKDINLPIPDFRRDDLLYGYYSSLERTFDQVKNHTNLFWFSHFFGLDKFIEILKNSTHTVVMDLAPYVSEKVGNKCIAKLTGEDELRNCFNQLKTAGVLHRLSFLYPIDEPDLTVRDAEEHRKMIEMTIKVASEYQELKDTKLAVIYGNTGKFWNIEKFDYVGTDYYKQKSEILTIGNHAKMLTRMQAGQKTILVPGPSFGHTPDPWVAYALINKDQVGMVVPFIWFDDPNHKDVAYTGLEACPEEFRNTWIQAGLKLQNKA